MEEEKKVLTAETLRASAERVVKIVQATEEKARGTHGFMAAFSLAQYVVKAVEEVGREIGALGPDKKAIAVQAILLLIPDSWCPDFLLEPLVSWAVERAVGYMNSRKSKPDESSK